MFADEADKLEWIINLIIGSDREVLGIRIANLNLTPCN